MKWMKKGFDESLKTLFDSHSSFSIEFFAQDETLSVISTLGCCLQSKCD
jgi:hypothetical protein